MENIQYSLGKHLDQIFSDEESEWDVVEDVFNEFEQFSFAYLLIPLIFVKEKVFLNQFLGFCFFVFAKFNSREMFIISRFAKLNSREI